MAFRSAVLPAQRRLPESSPRMRFISSSIEAGALPRGASSRARRRRWADRTAPRPSRLTHPIRVTPAPAGPARERSRMSVVVPLLRAAHLGPSLAVTALVALLAVAFDLSARQGVALTAAVLAGQLTVGWGNDLLDARRHCAAVARASTQVRIDSEALESVEPGFAAGARRKDRSRPAHLVRPSVRGLRRADRGRRTSLCADHCARRAGDLAGRLWNGKFGLRTKCGRCTNCKTSCL